MCRKWQPSPSIITTPRHCTSLAILRQTKKTVFIFVCLSVCLFARLLAKLWKNELRWNFIEGGCGPRNNVLDFGGDPNYNLDKSWIRIQDFYRILYLLLWFLQTVKNKTWQSSVEVWTLCFLVTIIIITSCLVNAEWHYVSHAFSSIKAKKLMLQVNKDAVMLRGCCHCVWLLSTLWVKKTICQSL